MAVPVADSIILMFLRPRPQISVCMVSSSFMVSTYRFNCSGSRQQAVRPRAGKNRRTHDLVNHDQYTRLGVLHCLQIAVDGAAQARVHGGVEVAIEACRLDVGRLGHEQEDVGLGGLGDEVQLVEDGALDVLCGAVDDEI